MSPEPRMPSLVSLGWSRFIVELKQFYRIPEQAFFTLILPLLLLVLFTIIFADAELEGPPQAERVTFAQYFVASMIAVGVMSSTFQYLAIAVAIEQHEGLLKRLGGTPLPRSAYFLGKIGLVIAITVAQVVLMLGYGVVVAGVELPTDPARWAVFAAVVALGGASLTFIGIAFTRFIPSQKAAAPMVVVPFLVLQFISGIFFVLDQIPAGLRVVASFFPLRWLAQGLRYVFLPDWFAANEPGGTWALDTTFAILIAWAVVGFIGATILFRWTRSHDT